MTTEPLYLVPTDKRHDLFGIIGTITGFMYAKPIWADDFHYCYQVRVGDEDYYVSARDVPQYFKILTEVERAIGIIDFDI